MAILSNINDKFAVDSTGAIQFNGQAGTSGYVLKSNGNAAPTWVDASTVIGGPYLPLSGGTLTGATATASGISFTVGGVLNGTSATFAGEVSLKSRLNLQRLSGGATTLIQFKNENGVDRAHIDFGGTDEELSFFAGAGSTENMRIDSSGNVGIGTGSATLDEIFEIKSGNGAGGDPATNAPVMKITNNTTSSSWVSGNKIGGIEYWTRDPSGNAPYVTSFINSINDQSGTQVLPSGALVFGTATYNAVGGAVERMRIDSSGKVKIGQDVGGSAFNGATVLQLSPYTSGQPVYIGLKSDTSNNCGILMGDSDDSYVGGFIYNNSNNYLVINTNNAERMRIDSSGNVDINAGVLNIGASRGTYIDASEDSTATGHIFVSNDAAGDFGQLAGNLILQARIHPTVYRDIIFAGGLNTAEALMTIQGEGNVGIGTTSPSANLHVQDTSTATLKVITTGVADASVNIQGYDAGVHIGDATNGLRWAIWNDGPSTSSSLKFGSYALGTWYNDGSQVVTMKSDGNVGIGTTSPSTKLEVVTTTSSTAIRCNVGQSSDIFLGFTGANPELLLQDNANIVTHRFESNGDNYIVGSNVGIGTTSPSGPFQVKVGTSTPLIVASSSYCNNVGIRTTTPTASLQVKGNVSYSYNNYTNVANTWINVINFSGYPAGLYQISIIKKTNASTYITAIVKWSATAGTVISTIASNQLGITFSGTQLQAISGIATGTLMSANLQCLVTNEDFCS